MKYTGVIAGLGNPGSQYHGTRHNMGFMAVDSLLEHTQREGRVEELSGAKYKSELWQCSLPEISTWLMLKPQTFMNLSGEAVQPLLAWHKIPPASLLVIHDDLDIPPGDVRFKLGGGDAGHNGLKSITQLLGTADYYRLRVGIGRPLIREDVTRWVLSRPSPDAIAALNAIWPVVRQSSLLFLSEGSSAVMNFLKNAKKKEQKDKPSTPK